MGTNEDTNWVMSIEGRLIVGVVSFEGPCMARGSVRIQAGSGVIEQFRGEKAKLTNLPRGLLDELSTQFPGVRWWVHDLPHRAPADTAS